MPQVAGAAIASYLVEAGYIGAASYAAAAGYIATGITVAIVATQVYIQQDSARKQQNAAKNAYNAGLQDRYVMSRAAAEARQLVLGRQRTSGPMFYVGSYGPNLQYLVFTVALAGHEIDGVEAIYFDDEQVILDADGNVNGIHRREQFSLSAASATYTLSSAPYAPSLKARVVYGATGADLVVTVTTDPSGKVITVSGGDPSKLGEVTVSYQPSVDPYATSETDSDVDSITLDAGGNGSVVLPLAPVGGSVHAVATTGGGQDQNSVDLSAYLSVSGSIVTLTGVPVDPNAAPVVASISYQTVVTTVHAKVRWHLGAPGQIADAGMIAALPGVWSTAHVANQVAYLVVEFNYDQNVFPNGIPNVSALMRGAKVYDPRTGTTAWSENAALLTRAAATHPLCGRLAASIINDASVIAAANICDVISNYPVGGLTYSFPRYTAGTVAKSGVKPADVLNDLTQAMAGKWVFVDGQLRIKAGAYVTPLQTLDESWLTDAQKVQIQPRANRADVYNTVTGKFVDRQQDYQALDYPQVTAASYITEDGTTLPLDVPLNAVTFTGQAQQVVASMMRDARQGLRLTVLCNMRAYPVEVFDTLYVTLSRFGWTNKPFEVYDVSWTLDGGIQLSMKEVDPAAWDMGLSFADTDPAPNTQLRSPFDVPAVKTLACQSGTAQLLKQADGTIVSRINATWDAITDPGVLTGGGVEVRYGVFNSTESTWQSVIAQGGQSQAFLTGVQDQQAYIVKARAFNSLVRGPWCPQVLHIVIGKTERPINVINFAATFVASGVRVAWDDDMEADYDSTEVRVGTVWETARSLFRGTASAYNWLSPSPGTYTLLAKHYDTSGNESLNAASVQVTVTLAAALQWANLVDVPANLASLAGTEAIRNADIIVGGVNLAQGSNDFVRFVFYGATRGASGLPDSLGGNSATRLALTASGLDMYRRFTGLRVGATYTVSLWMKLETASKCVLTLTNTVAWGTGGSVTVTASGWQRAVTTITTDTGALDVAIGGHSQPGVAPQSPGTVIACFLQVEEGNAATQWLPAPEDTAAIIATAQATADAAKLQLAVYADNNVLDRGEKPDVLLDWTALLNDQASIDPQAAAFGIVAERNNFDAAVGALAVYLNSIGPGVNGWFDTTVDSPIDRNVFNNQWANAYNNEQILITKISQVAGTIANWDTINGIPYSSVYNNDDSVALGFSMEDWPVGQAYPTGWASWAGAAPTRETGIVRAGRSAVRYSGAAGGELGMQRIADFRATPLAAGTFLSGSLDVYLVARSAGMPLLLVRLFTSSAVDGGGYRDTQVLPPNTATGQWQRVPWTARCAAGERIYAIRLYVMGSWSGGVGGQFSGDVVFDNVLFSLCDSSTDNTVIQLLPNGTATGGPSGQVTISGLGGGALATLNSVGTPQLDPASVTEVVTFTDAIGLTVDNRG